MWRLTQEEGHGGQQLSCIERMSCSACYESIGCLQGLRKVAVAELANVEGDLKREAQEDGELRERHGSAWRRPSSTALNAKFLEKVAGQYRHCVQASGCARHTARFGAQQMHSRYIESDVIVHH